MQMTWTVAIPIIAATVILGACTTPVAITPVTTIPQAAITAQGGVPTAVTAPGAVTVPVSVPTAVTPPNAIELPAALSGQTEFSLQVTPDSAQASFSMSQLQLDPEDIEFGYDVTVSVVVTNTGVRQSSYTVAVKIDDTIIAAQDVTIDGGMSRKVGFNVIPALPCGEYKVMAGNLAARLRVLW